MRRGDRATIAARFARSLIADLCDMLDAVPEGLEHPDLTPTDCHALTWPPPRENILRNL